MMPVLKRQALVDAKTGLPVYRQLTTATSYPQMAAVNTVQPVQPQPFISFPCKTAPDWWQHALSVTVVHQFNAVDSK